MLGVFSLGIFFPWANAIGAGVGIVSSLIFMLWIGIGAQVAKAQGFFKLPHKPYRYNPFNEIVPKQLNKYIFITNYNFLKALKAAQR